MPKKHKKIVYRVFGPFKVPRRETGLVDEPRAKQEFKERVDEIEGLSEASGCYIVSVHQRVWYVGLAGKFVVECFTPDKVNKMNHAIANGKGDACLHILARTTPTGRFTSKRCHKDTRQLETMLIQLALRRNTRLLNKGKTKFIRSVVVPGILNSQRGYAKGKSVRSLRKVLGISLPKGDKPEKEESEKADNGRHHRKKKAGGGFRSRVALYERTKSLAFIFDGNAFKATARVVQDQEENVAFCVCVGSTASLEVADAIPQSPARKRKQLLRDGIL